MGGVKMKKVPHVTKDGSREHVSTYTLKSDGKVIISCSEKNCEMNWWPSGPNYKAPLTRHKGV